jgi:hypothetical protein
LTNLSPHQRECKNLVLRVVGVVGAYITSPVSLSEGFWGWISL